MTMLSPQISHWYHIDHGQSLNHYPRCQHERVRDEHPRDGYGLVKTLTFAGVEEERYTLEMGLVTVATLAGVILVTLRTDVV